MKSDDFSGPKYHISRIERHEFRLGTGWPQNPQDWSLIDKLGTTTFFLSHTKLPISLTA